MTAHFHEEACPRERALRQAAYRHRQDLYVPEISFTDEHAFEHHRAYTCLLEDIARNLDEMKVQERFHEDRLLPDTLTLASGICR